MKPISTFKGNTSFPQRISVNKKRSELSLAMETSIKRDSFGAVEKCC